MYSVIIIVINKAYYIYIYRGYLFSIPTIIFTLWLSFSLQAYRNKGNRSISGNSGGQQQSPGPSTPLNGNPGSPVVMTEFRRNSVRAINKIIIILLHVIVFYAVDVLIMRSCTYVCLDVNISHFFFCFFFSMFSAAFRYGIDDV